MARWRQRYAASSMRCEQNLQLDKKMMMVKQVPISAGANELQRMEEERRSPFSQPSHRALEGAREQKKQKEQKEL
ncbi:MAG: hypothetical protein L6R39_003191 [Caloplaca ligustica]|nr:MAG: hypothetical protein L6R39_003191 [Caloplaca ligustica]